MEVKQLKSSKICLYNHVDCNIFLDVFFFFLLFVSRNCALLLTFFEVINGLPSACGDVTRWLDDSDVVSDGRRWTEEKANHLRVTVNVTGGEKHVFTEEKQLRKAVRSRLAVLLKEVIEVEPFKVVSREIRF